MTSCHKQVAQDGHQMGTEHSLWDRYRFEDRGDLLRRCPACRDGMFSGCELRIEFEWSVFTRQLSSSWFAKRESPVFFYLVRKKDILSIWVNSPQSHLTVEITGTWFFTSSSTKWRDRKGQYLLISMLTPIDISANVANITSTPLFLYTVDNVHF